MGIFMCPICGEKLELSGKTYVCGGRHSFDLARSGYVNLLTAKSGNVHGDNKLMLRARRDFLESGYYRPLCDKVSETVLKYAKNGCILLDAGCGEGYYTTAVRDAFAENSVKSEIVGIDISKDAVDMAAKRHSDVSYAAASVFHIPVMTASCDILLTMFAPYCGEEYRRVLKKGGVMIMVIPSEEHLWELKQAVYDEPYKNAVKDYALEGFRFVGSERVTFTMQIGDPEHIRSLFSMTPYYYRTGKTEQERLNALERLETKADFEILTYLTE